MQVTVFPQYSFKQRYVRSLWTNIKNKQKTTDNFFGTKDMDNIVTPEGNIKKETKYFCTVWETDSAAPLLPPQPL